MGQMNFHHYPPWRMLKLFTICLGVWLVLGGALYPCTFFMSTRNGVTFFGNNEDFHIPNTNVWFIPPQNDRYGYMCFGYDNGWPQGGMNDQGLCFDGASTPAVSLQFSPQKKLYDGILLNKIMAECATVEDVITIVKTFKFVGLHRQGQLMFVDPSGDAVIVGGPDADQDVDIIRKTGDTLVLTNFFPKHPEMGGHPCRRYQTATERLTRNPEPAVENFVAILKAVSTRTTQYSNVFHLNTQEIHLYHQGDFTHGLRFRLQDELKKGAHAYRIHHMFTTPREGESVEEINRRMERGRISRLIPKFVDFHPPDGE